VFGRLKRAVVLWLGADVLVAERDEALRASESLRSEVDEVRTELSRARRSEELLAQRLAFVQRGHGIANRLLRDIKAERDGLMGERDRLLLANEDAEIRSVLATSDFLRVVEFNETLLREIGRSAAPVDESFKALPSQTRQALRDS
jgi:hypothetical protein